MAKLSFNLLEDNRDWSLAKAAEPYKGKTVRLYNVAGYEFNAILPKVLPEFEKETGIKVQVDLVTYGEAVEKHIALLAAGSDLYDLYNIDSIWFPQYQPYLEPLTRFMKDPKLYDPKFDYYDLVHECQWTNSWEGEPYMFSCMYTFPAVYYNKEYFKAAGLDPEREPVTWTDWNQYAKKLTTKISGQQVYGQTVHGLRTAMMEIVTSRYLSAGGRMFDDYLHPTLDNDLLKKYLAQIQQEYKDGTTPPGTLDFELGEAAAAYKEGRTAMCWNWQITVAWVEDPSQSKVAGKNGYALPPSDWVDWPTKYQSPPGGNTRLASFGQAIAKKARNKEAAYLLAQWIGSKSVQTKVTELGDSAPSRYSILYGPLKNKYPHFPILRVAPVSGVLWNCPKIPNEAQWEDTIAVEFQKCMIGELTPDQAAKNAEMRVFKLMKDYGYYQGNKKYPVEMTANVQKAPCPHGDKLPPGV